MQFTLKITIFLCFIGQMLSGGNCASKVVQEPRSEAWAGVTLAAGSSKQAQEKTAAAGIASIALLSAQDKALAQAMSDALPVPQLLNIVIGYLDDTPFLVRSFFGHKASVSTVQAMSNKEFISSDGDCGVRLWNVSSDQSKLLVEPSLRLKNKHFLASSLDKPFITISNCGIYIPSNPRKKGFLHTISLWHKDRNNLIKTFCLASDFSEVCIEVLNANNFAIGDGNGMVQVWHKDHNEPQDKFKAHESTVTCMAQIDDSHFISGSEDKTIKLWQHGQARKLKAILQTYTARLKVPATAAAPAMAKK